MNSLPKSKDGYSIMIGDETEWGLISLGTTTRQKAAENWSERLARVPDDMASYRFINYLTETGLLNDSREAAGKGWRKFSYVECVYLQIVISLRKFGVQAEHIMPIYKLFSKPYDSPDKVGYMALDWLDILLAVHCGTEFELLVHEDGQVVLADPPFMHLVGVNATEGSLRISLSAIINKLRQSRGMQPIKISRSFSSSPLNAVERDTVIEMRDLQHGQEALHIKRTSNGGTLLEKERTEDISSEFASQIGGFLDEDFMTIQATKRDGKVVNIKKTKQTLYKN